MSSDFGKQFIDARNSRGITLEVAAEATKIREKYLKAIENDIQNIGVPDIYARGFVRTYAKYLGLNADEVAAKCPIKKFEVIDVKTTKKGAYSTVVTNEKEKEEDAAAGVNDKPSFSEKIGNAVSVLKNISKNKRVMTVVCSLFAILVIGILILKIAPNKTGHATIPSTQAEKVFGSSEQATLSLIATGNVQVVVRAKESGEKIFTGTLESGTIKKIPYSQPIQVFYSNGEFLLIKQTNGEQLYPQPGRGGVEIK